MTTRIAEIMPGALTCGFPCASSSMVQLLPLTSSVGIRLLKGDCT